MKRIVVALTAAAVVVAGAIAVGATTPLPAAAESPDDDRVTELDRPLRTHPVPADRQARPHPVREVLDALVADGTLTQAQSDAVAEALRDAFADRAAGRDAARRDAALRDAARRGARAGVRIGVLLADGIIDAEELAGLPEDHVLRDAAGPAGPYLDDGALTVEELRQIRSDLRDRASVDG